MRSPDRQESGRGVPWGGRDFIPLAAALSALTLLWAALGMFEDPVFPLDDPYIVLKNALVLAGRDTVSFPEASPLAGSTSLVHLLLVRVALVFLAPLHASSAVSFLGAALYAVAMYRLPILLGRTHRLAGVWLIVGLCPGLSLYHLSNGMETSLAIAAVAWAVVLSLEDERRRRSQLPLLLGVMPFVRPELGALTLLLAIARMADFRQTSSGTREFLARSARLWALICLAAAPFVVIFLVTVGSPFPNTVGAKKYYYAYGCRPLLENARVGLTLFGRFLLPLGVVALGLIGLLGRRGRVFGVFLLVFLGLYVSALPDALAHNVQRYPYVLLPLFGYGLMLATRERWFEVPVLSLLVLQIVAWNVPSVLNVAIQERRFTIEENAGVGEWIRENLPPHARLLVHDAGFISLATPNPLVDLVGLKTPAVTEVHERITWTSCGAARPEAFGEIVQRYEPHYVVVLDTWDRHFGITEGIREYRTLTPERLREGGYGVYRVD